MVKKKEKIVKRPAGLVINPPSPRPVEGDHPILKWINENTPATSEANANLATQVDLTTLANLATQDKLATQVNMTTVAKVEEPPQPLATVAILTDEAKMTTDVKMTSVAKMTTVVKVAEVKGELRLSNSIVDNLFPLLDPTAAMLYLRLYRLSHGYRKDTCTVGLEKLASALNSGERTIQRAIERLEKMGLIEKQGAKFGGSLKGNIFKVNLPEIEADLTAVAKMATQAKTTTVAKMTDNKDLDHDFKEIDHHQSETMTYYQDLTGNSWTKADDVAYDKVKHISLDHIHTTIEQVIQRAPKKPATLAYFVKEILSPTQANPKSRVAQERELERIIKDVKYANRHRNGYLISELCEDVKEECARQGIAYDNDLFNKLIS